MRYENAGGVRAPTWLERRDKGDDLQSQVQSEHREFTLARIGIGAASLLISGYCSRMCVRVNNNKAARKGLTAGEPRFRMRSRLSKSHSPKTRTPSIYLLSRKYCDNFKAPREALQRGTRFCCTLFYPTLRTRRGTRDSWERGGDGWAGEPYS